MYEYHKYKYELYNLINKRGHGSQEDLRYPKGNIIEVALVKDQEHFPVW